MIPVRPSSHFDENLQDIPDDVQAWEKYVSDLQEMMKVETSEDTKLELLEIIGMSQRTLRRLDQAEKSLLQAVSLSYSHSKPGKIVQNLVRLAHVYQWKKEFQKGQLLFDQAFEVMKHRPISAGLTASVHQHLGKLYFDNAYYGKAQAEFALAFHLRELNSAPQDQRESTQQSLAEALRRWGRSFPVGTLVRRAQESDAEALHEAHMRSIQEVCSQDHTAEEIQAWGHRPFNQQQRVHTIVNDKVWVVQIQDKIEGYGHLRIFENDGIKQAHVMGLYLNRAALGKSLGQALLQLVMEECKYAGVKIVALESTRTAREFYRRNGFMETSGEQSIQINGTAIRCYPMKLNLP